MKINDLLDLTLREVLENYVALQSLECGYYYGITNIEDLQKLDENYRLKEYVEEYGESFFAENLISDELLIDGDKSLLSYEKLENICNNLGIDKK